jgi:transcription elongation factor Elf1
MEFRCFCDNKGCGKEMRPVVDKATMIAYCTECGKAINNISIFMRRQMVSHDQVRRDEKKKLPWAVKCTACNKEGPPELSKDMTMAGRTTTSNTLVCSFCGKELTTLAKPFAEMIKVNLKAQKRADGK